MNLFDLFATINLDSKGYEDGLDNAESNARSFGNKAGAAIKSGMKVATAAITAASGAVAGFTGIAVKAGREFDSAMSQIAATLGITTEEIENNVGGAGDTFAALRDKAKEMGAATNFSASQAADGLNILAMSGFNAEQSMAMLEDVLHLAAAGSMDMASAAGFISGAMKGFNDATKDSGYYADLMAKGATLANTSVSQLGDAMSSGAAGAAAYSQTAESMTVALLRLAEQGDVGAAAGTALSAAMKNLYTPTDQAAGALAELGVAAYDSNGAARDFNTVVNELDAALSGYSEEQRNAYKQTIFGIQGLNAYNKMTVTSTDKQEQWSAALAAAGDGAGEAAKQYNTMTDNLQGDVDIWNSALDGFKIEISDKVMPTIRSFVQLGSTGMGKITEAFKKGGFAKAAKALGGVLGELVGKITKVIPTVVESASNLLMAFAQALVDNSDMLIQTGFDVLLMLLRGITENGEMISTAIGSLIESIGLWVGEYSGVIISGVANVLIMIAGVIAENAPVFIEQLSFVILELAAALTDPKMISSLLTAMLTIVESIANSLTENMPTLIQTIMTVIDNIVTFITENLPVFVESALQIILALVDGLVSALPQLLAYLPTIITSMVDALLGMLPQLIDAGVQLLTALVKNLDEIITTIVAVLPDIINAIVTVLTNNIPVIVQAGITLLTALVENLDEIITAIVGVLPDIIDAIITTLIDNIQLIIDAGVQLLTALIDNLPLIINTIVNALPKIIDGIVLALIGAIPDLVNAGVTLFTSLITNIPQIVANIVSKLPEIIGGMIKGILGFVPNMIEAGKNLLGGLAEGVKNAASGVWNGIKSVGSSIVSGIKGLFGIRSPSKVFANIGEMLDKGLEKGINDYAGLAVKAAETMGDEVAGAVDPNINFAANGNSLGAFGSIVINVQGAEGQDVNELAEVISQKMAYAYSQEQVVWA